VLLALTLGKRGLARFADMRTHRTLTTIALIAVTAIGLAACTAVNEVLTDRDLICEETPDDLCLRIADLAVRPLDRASEMTVTHVSPADCAMLGHGPNPRLVVPDGGRQRRLPDATRCWYVEGTDTINDIGFGVWVYERPDGTLAMSS
jgi:hypothetical protein